LKDKILKQTEHKIDLEVYESLASTNDLLKQKAINGAKEGTAVLSFSQTDGKGRKGRTFISEKGGIYLSILVRPKTFNFDTTLITSATAVAVSKAIEEISNIKTDIKWVNDILIGGKKVCGILCESGICGSDSFVVVGIGINVFKLENNFADEIKDIATYVFEKEDNELFIKLTAKVIDNFFYEYNSIHNLSFLDEYRKRSVCLGKEISVYGKTAKALEIDNRCRLKVEYADGKQEYLSTGEISIKLKEL
jgi:BirA family biotin operon repressor/biotin-[acetyl-CoA-carboxylase] ligase